MVLKEQNSIFVLIFLFFVLLSTIFSGPFRDFETENLLFP